MPSHSTSNFAASSWVSPDELHDEHVQHSTQDQANVASIGSSVASAGFRPVRTTCSNPALPPPAPPSTPLTTSLRAASTTSFGPAVAGSQIRAEGGPIPSPCWTHHLVTCTVTSLLHLLTSPIYTNRRRVFRFKSGRLISQLLQSSFPLALATAAGHKLPAPYAGGHLAGLGKSRSSGRWARTRRRADTVRRVSTDPEESLHPGQQHKIRDSATDEVYVREATS
jgi:hypothetical protein